MLNFSKIILTFWWCFNGDIRHLQYLLGVYPSQDVIEVVVILLEVIKCASATKIAPLKTLNVFHYETQTNPHQDL